jgi:hypothetical protein
MKKKISFASICWTGGENNAIWYGNVLLRVRNMHSIKKLG